MNREVAKSAKKTFLDLGELCVFAVKMVRCWALKKAVVL